MIWCCFHGEKCQKKNQKKASGEKKVLLHISTMGALYNIIQTDWEATVQDYNFHFITSLGNWSCDHSPDDLLDGP